MTSSVIQDFWHGQLRGTPAIRNNSSSKLWGLLLDRNKVPVVEPLYCQHSPVLFTSNYVISIVSQLKVRVVPAQCRGVTDHLRAY